MKSDKTADNYKLESSYTSKSGLKVRSYVPFYNSEDRKFFIQEEITKSCLRIYEKIKQ